jgi:hypothetical protein
MEGLRSMSPSEHTVRDALCSRLGLIEPGLSLLNKEQYVPNVLGTRSFIDIFAVDSRGKYTIIELKRSNAASRQAIHEIYKYIEGIKNHFGLQEDEIRVIIISTEWHELLVPYSSFVLNTTMDVTGYALQIDEKGNPLKLTKVIPVELPGGRLLAPWHDLNLYTDSNSLQKGINQYQQVCDQKGIESYVIVVLSAAPDFRERELAFFKSTLRSINEDSTESRETPSDDELARLIPEHAFILYFAHQQLTLEKYLSLCKGLPSAMEEIPDDFDELVEESKIAALHSILNAVDPRPHYDHYEIGYPAKFAQKLLVDEKWKIENIIRGGAFKRNKLLSDEQIISGLSAHQGITQQRYVKNFRTDDRSQLALMRNEVRFCLEDNKVWQTHILYLLDEIYTDFDSSDCYISIYNPNNIMLSLQSFSTLKADGVLYVPQYIVRVGDDKEPSRIYFGFLQATGSAIPLSILIERYFGGNADAALINLIWGGYQDNDSEVVRDIGFSYMTARVDCSIEKNERKILHEMHWRRINRLYRPEDYFQEYINGNQHFIDDLNKLYGARFVG